MPVAPKRKAPKGGAGGEIPRYSRTSRYRNHTEVTWYLVTLMQPCSPRRDSAVGGKHTLTGTLAQYCTVMIVHRIVLPAYPSDIIVVNPKPYQAAKSPTAEEKRLSTHAVYEIPRYASRNADPARQSDPVAVKRCDKDAALAHQTAMT